MELREEIILTAIRLFDRKGLKFTMQDVAQELHISKKTIYVEFDSKESLLAGILDYGFGRIRAAKQKVLDMDLPLPEKLARVMIALPEDYRMLDFRRLSGLHEKYPAAAERLGQYLESDWEPVFALMDQGVSEGILRPVPHAVIQLIVSGSIDRFLSDEKLTESGIAYQEALDAMMDLLMRGMLRQAEPASAD